MVAKRPIGDKIPTEHLHALRLEFGTKPASLPILQRIFEDSLAPNVALLISAEKINDIDSYADRANELYILWEHFKSSAIAAIEPVTMATTEVSFTHTELIETMKNLTKQVAFLSTEINHIKQNNAQGAAVATHLWTLTIKMQATTPPHSTSQNNKLHYNQLKDWRTDSENWRNAPHNQSPGYFSRPPRLQQHNLQYNNDQQPRQNTPRQQIPYETHIDNNGHCS